MLNLIDIPQFTTLECQLSDLPSDFEEQIRIHMKKDEEVLICILSRSEDKEIASTYGALYIHVATDYRIVSTYAIVDQKKKELRLSENGSVSILLGTIQGFRLEPYKFEFNKVPVTSYRLKVLTYLEGELALRFYSLDKVKMFSQVILTSSVQR